VVITSAAIPKAKCFIMLVLLCTARVRSIVAAPPERIAAQGSRKPDSESTHMSKEGTTGCPPPRYPHKRRR
jgi:hypothetical protein